jgi:DNA-binding transcriptional ArsR family regulator
VTGVSDEQEVAALARLLAHPLRVRILDLLVTRGACATELAPHLGASVSAVAYHLRLLADGGALELAATVRVRGTLQHTWRRAPGLGDRLERLSAWLTRAA